MFRPVQTGDAVEWHRQEAALYEGHCGGVVNELACDLTRSPRHHDTTQRRYLQNLAHLHSLAARFYHRMADTLADSARHGWLLDHHTPGPSGLDVQQVILDEGGDLPLPGDDVPPWGVPFKKLDVPPTGGAALTPELLDEALEKFPKPFPPGCPGLPPPDCSGFDLEGDDLPPPLIPGEWPDKFDEGELPDA